MQSGNHIKLLLVTSGTNSCVEYLGKRTDLDLYILDLKEKCIRTKDEVNSYISDISPDLLFVYRCPFIISKKAYSIPRIGAYNIHPSLLPKHRGLNPWIGIFKNKEEKNGVTLHRITDVVDGGEIIYQQSYSISPNETVDEARNNADIIASRLLAKFLDEYIPEHEKFIDLYPLANKYDYIAAIADKSNLLVGSLVKDGVVTDSVGVEYCERAYSIVFKIRLDNKDMALRCWKCIGYEDSVSICRRMTVISEDVRMSGLPYFEEFSFYESGILTCKGIYPVMIMDWISAPDLKQYIQKNLYDREKLYNLADKFLTMAAALHKAKIAHGDLQVANIRVRDDGSLFLIDYDTLYTPTLNDEQDNVKGKLCFQHHSRQGNRLLSPYMDYFPEYVIYFGIKALANYPELYAFLEMDKNDFIFTEEELTDIKNGRIFKFIYRIGNKELVYIAESLVEAWLADSMDKIVPLEMKLFF